VRQVLEQIAAAGNAWTSSDASLAVHVKDNQLVFVEETLLEFRIPLVFADVAWITLERGAERSSPYPSGSSRGARAPEVQHRCVFGLSPRWPMMQLGTAKGVEETDVEEIWLVCASFGSGSSEMAEFLHLLGTSGALRWDFNSSYLLTCTVLGSGGYSIVYEGQPQDDVLPLSEALEDENELPEAWAESDRELQGRPRRVALKLLQKVDNAEQSISVVNEVYFLSTCGRHPNISSMLGTYLSQQRYRTVWIIAMTLYPHGRLMDWVEMNGPFFMSKGDIVSVCLLSAVAFLHSKNIIHRDIRPEKVMLAADLCPVLMDLGQAAHLDDSVAMMRRLGTVGYVAPEVVDTRSPGYGSLSDVFSAGALLFYVYCGIEALREANTSASLQRTLAGKAKFSHPKVKQVRTGTLHLLKKMLSISPKVRPKAAKACKALWNLGTEEVHESPTALKAYEALPKKDNETQSYARLQPVVEMSLNENLQEDTEEHSYCPSPAYSVHTHSMPIPVIAKLAAAPSTTVGSDLLVPKPPAQSTKSLGGMGDDLLQQVIPRPPSSRSSGSRSGRGFFSRISRMTMTSK